MIYFMIIIYAIVLLALGVLLFAAIKAGRSKPRESQQTAFAAHIEPTDGHGL